MSNVNMAELLSMLKGLTEEVASLKQELAAKPPAAAEPAVKTARLAISPEVLAHMSPATAAKFALAKQTVPANQRDRKAKPGRTWMLLADTLPVIGCGPTAPIMAEIAAILLSEMEPGTEYDDAFVIETLNTAVEMDTERTMSLSKSKQSVTFHLDYFYRGKANAGIIGYADRGFMRRSDDVRFAG